MSAPQEELSRKAARRILTDVLQIKKGENVIIETWGHTLPYAGIMIDEARRLGARTLTIYEDEASFWSLLDRKQAQVYGASSAPEWAALKQADAYVFFWGPEDRPRFDGYSEKVIDQAFAFNMTWYKEAKKAGIRGVRMELGFATERMAREWDADLDQWREDLLRASAVDPRTLERSGKRLARALERGKRLTITHPNGTDLTLGLKGLRPYVYSGLFTPQILASPFGQMMNVPSGRLGIALDEKVGEGILVANRPSYMSEHRVDGAHWTFENGKLTESSFAAGDEHFQDTFKKSKGAKDRVSYLYLGLNPKIHATPNMEDAELGGAMVGIGDNTRLGGTNKSDFMGWAVVGEGKVAVDGKAIIRDGKVL